MENEGTAAWVRTDRTMAEGKEAERQFIAKEVAEQAEDLRTAKHGHAQAKRKVGEAKRAFLAARQELYVHGLSVGSAVAG